MEDKMARKSKVQDQSVVEEKQGEAEVAPVAVQQQNQDLDLQKDLKCGYVVGMKADGNFVFSVVGKEPGLMELLGLHHHANTRIKRLYSNTQMTDDTLVLEVAKMVDTVGGLVNGLSQKLDKLLDRVDPKKPDNKVA